MDAETKPTVVLDPFAAVRDGLLPLREQAIRFAVGDPGGLTSNAWRVWAQGQGDIYLACRDSFKETKVSLHVSGRWRFGFTAEAANARSDLVPAGADRAMEVWDKPKEFVPGVIQAFKLYFPVSTLFVTPEKRNGKKWKDVLYIEEGNFEASTILAVYVTESKEPFSFSNIRSFCLGIWALPDGTFAQLVAQVEPGNIEKSLDAFVAQGKAKAQQAGVEVPEIPLFQFWGTDSATGARFIVILPDRPLAPAINS